MPQKKEVVDKLWPEDPDGVVEGDSAAKRQAQRRQRRGGLVNYTFKGLRPRLLQLEAQENLKQHTNATLDNPSTQIMQRFVGNQLFSYLFNYEEQTLINMAL